MPLQLPVLDNRNFEQLLAEAKRRIPVYTPEWTNFEIDSDPGITIVQLFAFLTENLLYRADRIPERNRLKFLQLLGIPLQQAAPALGIVRVRNERGPVEPLPLEAGIVVSADPPAYDEFSAKYQAIKAAKLAALEAEAEGDDEEDESDDFDEDDDEEL